MLDPRLTDAEIYQEETATQIAASVIAETLDLCVPPILAICAVILVLTWVL